MPREKMPFPFQLSFHGAERSPDLEEAVSAQVANLGSFHPRIHGCWVTIGKESHRHQRGDRYTVQVRVAIPGNDVVVGHHRPRAQHEDPFIAITDTFQAVQRKLEDDARLRRGDVKARAESLVEARVVRLDVDHGFIETRDGRELFFHKNSLIDFEFDDLDVGAPVRFKEEQGQKGPQASTVHVI